MFLNSEVFPDRFYCVHMNFLIRSPAQIIDKLSKDFSHLFINSECVIKNMLSCFECASYLLVVLVVLVMRNIHIGIKFISQFHGNVVNALSFQVLFSCV